MLEGQHSIGNPYAPSQGAVSSGNVVTDLNNSVNLIKTAQEQFVASGQQILNQNITIAAQQQEIRSLREALRSANAKLEHHRRYRAAEQERAEICIEKHTKLLASLQAASAASADLAEKLSGAHKQARKRELESDVAESSSDSDPYMPIDMPREPPPCEEHEKPTTVTAPKTSPTESGLEQEVWTVKY